MSKAPIRALFLDDDRGVAEATKEALASRGIEVISLAAPATSASEQGSTSWRP